MNAAAASSARSQPELWSEVDPLRMQSLAPEACELLETYRRDVGDLTALPIEEARQHYNSFANRHNRTQGAAGAIVRHAEIPCAGYSLVVDLIYPASWDGEARLPVLLFFHGGGFVFGSPETRRPQCSSIANRTGCLVVSATYSLAPEVRCPVQFHECRIVAEWLLANIDAICGDAERIGVGGDSAGATFAAALCVPGFSPLAGRLAVSVLIYPWLDLMNTGPSQSIPFGDQGFFLSNKTLGWYRSRFLSSVPNGTDYSFDFFARDVSKSPPTLIIMADCDPLMSEGVGYANRLLRSGQDVSIKFYRGMPHGFWLWPAVLQAARDAQTAVVEAISNGMKTC